MDRAGHASDETAVSLDSMAQTSRQVHYTYAEYVAFENFSDARHEYLEGEIYAMAGGTEEHAVLAAAVISIIRSQLSRGCRVATSDLRVRVSAKVATYPDATVICGDRQPAPEDPLAVTNPLVLVEVTSHSTEQYDRGLKLQHYRTMPTLKEILIVSHREQRLSVHRRDGDEWTVEEAVAGGSVRLESVGVRLDVDDVYRDAR